MRKNKKIQKSHKYQRYGVHKGSWSNEYESDLCSNEHYLSSSENKACTGFESMNSVIPMQCSTNWANISQLAAGHNVGSK